jgi:uncharacterized membrane protein
VYKESFCKRYQYNSAYNIECVAYEREFEYDSCACTEIDGKTISENEKGVYDPSKRTSEIYITDFRSKEEIKMDKLFVVVFDCEAKAYEGLKALHQLEQEGSINLYAKAVIAREASGNVTVKQEEDLGPIGTTVGLVTGGLIGLIGGPAGVAIGASVGTFMGLMYDLVRAGVDQDFLDDVEQSLLPGKAAIVAEVWEEWTLPIDTRMESLGGSVFRCSLGQVLDAQIEMDVAALEADLDELQAEHDQATGEARAKLQKQIDATKGRLQAAQDDIQTRIETSQKETEAKIKSLQEQADKARGERKAKLDKRIAELKADQRRRNDQLKQAWEHTKEALPA